MKLLTPIVLAAGLALSGASAASAMTDQEMVQMGQSMLTGALYNSLRAEGHPTDGIEKLTLSEIVVLNDLLHSDASQSERANQIRLIFERANAR